jgi:hypothetical protein
MWERPAKSITESCNAALLTRKLKLDLDNLWSGIWRKKKNKREALKIVSLAPV